MSPLWGLLWALEPATAWRQVPIVPTEASTLYAQVSQEPVACSVEVDLSITGEIRGVMPLSCPDSLFEPVRGSLVQWGFSPATEGEKAVAVRQRFTAVFESNTVWLPSQEGDRYAHIRVPPFALPQWPRSPQQDAGLKALFASVSLPGASCVLEMGLSKRGEPEDLVIVSCPNEIAHSVEKSLRRWGMRSVGAELGDGTRYRMEMRF